MWRGHSNQTIAAITLRGLRLAVITALHQALARRYVRLCDEQGPLPDILFIDGGKGQLAQAGEVLGAVGRDRVKG